MESLTFRDLGNCSPLRSHFLSHQSLDRLYVKQKDSLPDFYTYGTKSSVQFIWLAHNFHKESIYFYPIENRYAGQVCFPDVPMQLHVGFSGLTKRGKPSRVVGLDLEVISLKI